MAYKCDRCGELYDGPVKSSSVYACKYDYGTDRFVPYDLCPKCSDDLLKFMYAYRRGDINDE